MELRTIPVQRKIGFPTEMEVTRPWGSCRFASPALSPPSLHGLSGVRVRVKFVGGMERKLAHCVFRKVSDSQASQREQIPDSCFLGFSFSVKSSRGFLLLRSTQSAGVDADFAGKVGTRRQRSWAEGLRILGQPLLCSGEVLGFMREDEESTKSLCLKLLREKQSREERYKNVNWNNSSRLQGFGFSGYSPISTGINLAIISEEEETRQPMLVHERVEESRNRSPEDLAFTLEKHTEELGSRRGDEETDLGTWEQVSEDAQKCNLQGSGFMIPKPTSMLRTPAYMISNKEVMDEGFWFLTGDHRENTLRQRSSAEDAEFERHANNFKVSVEAYQETEIDFEIDLDNTPPDLGADREFGDWCGYWVGPSLDDGWGYVTAFIS